MGVSKVIYNGNTLLDLTADNVAAANLLKGFTAHDKAGNAVVGNVVIQHYYTGTSVPPSSLGENGDIYLQS